MTEINSLTPKEIVAQLDRFIVGQGNAKKAVAIALRNRWRRKNVDSAIKEEIVPKNILMVGPTGVGKTEIARRLAKLSNSPFIKIEATKFTEVGYVGRDVDSIIRDLVDNAIYIIKEMHRKAVHEDSKEMAYERILDALVGKNATKETRDKYKMSLLSGGLNDQIIEIEVIDNPQVPSVDIPMPGGQMGIVSMSDVIGKFLGGDRVKKKSLKIREALEIAQNEEADKLIDEDKINRDAISLVEQEGIVFIDEIDKISGGESKRGEVSREGVQRDLLPLIEGTTVNTKYGIVKTDYILFIASGAFHLSKPSDLLPELQGRLPIRVELSPLSEEDMYSILTEPEYSLLKQYSALLKTENFDLSFDDSGVKAIAALSAEINRNVENIGARRLHTILEKLLEEVSFTACDLGEKAKLVIDAEYVHDKLGNITKISDLSKFIL